VISGVPALSYSWRAGYPSKLQVAEEVFVRVVVNATFPAPPGPGNTAACKSLDVHAGAATGVGG
jgi:hypothetical protein